MTRGRFLPYATHADLLRINCRLPQTPRTPGAQAEHYFDDILSRATRRGSTNGRSRHLRRSSTVVSRSIGRRSSYANTVHGDGDGDEDADDDDDEDAGEEPKSVGPSVRDEDEKEKAEADRHVAKYVSDQLERIRSNEDRGSGLADEFEAQLDS